MVRSVEATGRWYGIPEGRAVRPRAAPDVVHENGPDDSTVETAGPILSDFYSQAQVLPCHFRSHSGEQNTGSPTATRIGLRHIEHQPDRRHLMRRHLVTNHESPTSPSCAANQVRAGCAAFQGRVADELWAARCSGRRSAMVMPAAATAGGTNCDRERVALSSVNCSAMAMRASVFANCR